MIAVLDYGTGNLHSVERALAETGSQVEVTSDFQTAFDAEGLVIPGVGEFGRCMRGLRQRRGDELIKARLEKNRPTLGICVGLQILFAGSSENESESGVGIFPERIEKLDAPVIPHMGWNQVQPPSKSRLFQGLDLQRFYFVHSYARVLDSKNPNQSNNSNESGSIDYLAASSEYGQKFLAALEYGSLSATQFHPEKSGSAGLKLLANWVGSLSEF